MKKLAGLMMAAALALAACGGSPAVMSDAEVEAGLATYADQINGEGVGYDTWSRLTRATAMSKTITIRGETEFDLAELNEMNPNYYSSRVIQGEDKLCTDEVHRELLRGNATVNFNWFSADGESLGEMITIRGDEVCSAYE